MEPADVVEYSEQYYVLRHRSPAFQAELRWAMALVDGVPPDPVLEVGCGGGALLARVAARGFRAVGIDSNLTGLSLARRTEASIRVVAASAADLPFRDGVFAAVVAQHVIEHFEAPHEIVREWIRVMRPGGQLVVVTPNRFYPDPESFFDPTHRHIYSTQDLISLMQSQHLQVESCSDRRPFLFSRKLELLACMGAEVFQRMPGFQGRGASLVLAARKP